MRKHRNYFLILLPILLLVAGSVLAEPKKAGPNHGASKVVTACGTVLAEPGNYKLAHDLLDCLGNGIEITGSDIKLNLKGHEISCADNNLDVAGVIVYGAPDAMVRNVRIKNGHVSNCKDGIVLIDTEDSTVMNMASTGNTFWWVWIEHPDGSYWAAYYGTGITLYRSRNNVIMHNHTDGNASDGIGSWESSGNLFKHNTSTDNGDELAGAGINLSYEYGSKVLCNRTHGNADGILLWDGSSDNLLRGNLVTANRNTGIGMVGYFWQEDYVAMPSGNTIRKNIVENNPWVDVFEAYWDFGENLLLNPDGLCRNTWQMNQFQTQEGLPGCIGTGLELDEKDVCALDDDHDD